MQDFVEEVSLTVTDTTLEVFARPHPDSYDSASECSLDHWLEVCHLVDEEFVIAEMR